MNSGEMRIAGRTKIIKIPIGINAGLSCLLKPAKEKKNKKSMKEMKTAMMAIIRIGGNGFFFRGR